MYKIVWNKGEKEMIVNSWEEAKSIYKAERDVRVYLVEKTCFYPAGYDLTPAIVLELFAEVLNAEA